MDNKPPVPASTAARMELAKPIPCSAVVGDGDALRAEIEAEFAKWWGGPVKMELMSCYSGHCAFKAGFLAGRARGASSPTATALRPDEKAGELP